MERSSVCNVKEVKCGKHVNIRKGKGTKTIREGRDGSRLDMMAEATQTRTGGYGGPSDFDDLELVRIDRTESEVLAAGRRAFLEQLSELQDKFPNQWVAFDGATFLGAADTEPELLGKFNPRGEFSSRIFTDYVFSS